MNLDYIAKDDRGNVGQTLPLIRGESRTVSIYLFNPDGTPFDYSQTISTIAAKIFSAPNVAAITKTPTALSKAGASTSGLIGIQFSLTGTDTNSMAANSVGLPMSMKITDSLGGVLEVDFATLFTVTDPVV